MESNDRLEQLLRKMYAQESLHDDDIDTSDIVDEEWTKFEAEHFSENEKMRDGENEKWRDGGNEKWRDGSCFNSSIFQSFNSFKKIAAMFIGVLMLSGIAYAAVQMINSSSQKAQEEQTATTPSSQLPTLNSQQPEQDNALHKPVVYEDAELATILNDIAAFYQVEPVYKKKDSRHIRLYFTWDKKQTLDDIIDTFNKFERIHITRDNQKLIVE